MNIIHFPNLNIGPMVIDPVAFSIFGRDIAWYGIIITFGIFCAVAYVMYRAKKEKLREDDVYDYALFTVIVGIICARLYYVIFDPTPNYKNIIDVFAIWNGGLAIYGGIIGGALTVLAVSRVKKIYFLRVADMAAPAVMIAQSMGRWGNFMNGEAYGSVEKFDFFFFGFDISGLMDKFPLLMNVGGIDAQPTFLYESVWNLIGFLLLVFFVDRFKKFAGMTMLSYFAWYGFGRMFIEGLRTDSLYIPGSDTMRVSQLIAFMTFAVSVALIIVLSIKSKAHPYNINDSVYYGKKTLKIEDNASETDAESEQGIASDVTEIQDTTLDTDSDKNEGDAE